MQMRLVRALFLLVVATMLAVYAASAASRSTPTDLHDGFEVVGEQWC